LTILFQRRRQKKSPPTWIKFNRAAEGFDPRSASPFLKVDLEGSNAWRDAGKRILHIDNLAMAIKGKPDMKNFTSAEFALQMIEKVEGATFSITTPAG
jgi:hypothetical protein